MNTAPVLKLFQPCILNQVALNRVYSEDTNTKHTNVTTKLKLKLLTKAIKTPSEGAWVSG